MSTNPFDDDYRDYTGALSAKPLKSYTTVESPCSVEEDVNFYEREIEKYMQESLDSSQRARKKLEESEQLGIATAQDLLTQREKLENTEKNLDEIDVTTKLTQRSLNSLKSVVGGFFKNKFSRAAKGTQTERGPSKSSTSLNNVVDNLDNGHNFRSGAVSSAGPTLSESARANIIGTRWEVMDKEIDVNLDSMSSQLSRLQKLGIAIGEEVGSQNELLDRIQVKADRSDVRVKDQDNQMKRLLGNVIKEDAQQSSLPSVSKRKLMFSAVKGAF